MKDWASDLLQRCEKSGFPLVGIIDIDRADEISPGFSSHFARYESWVRDGKHGEMKYLERGLERRRDPRHVFPEAKSILSLAIPYRRGNSPEPGDPQPRYARYIQGPDYHARIPEMLTAAFNGWRETWKERYPDAKWKICVDTSALLERSWAVLSGLGWIGKNTLLIHPKHGSYLFLAFALLNLESDQGPRLLPDYCGNCTRCLQSCPTGAIEDPHVLNANRCVAYLTLEKRGEIRDESLRRGMGQWIAGCDVCQEVCPFNRKPSALPETWPLLTVNEATSLTSWEDLLSETEESYRGRTRSSALERIKWRDWQRNLAIALANAGREQPELIASLETRIQEKLVSTASEPDLHFLWSRVSENSSA